MYCLVVFWAIYIIFTGMASDQYILSHLSNKNWRYIAYELAPLVDTAKALVEMSRFQFHDQRHNWRAGIVPPGVRIGRAFTDTRGQKQFNWCAWPDRALRKQSGLYADDKHVNANFDANQPERFHCQEVLVTDINIPIDLSIKGMKPCSLQENKRLLNWVMLLCRLQPHSSALALVVFSQLGNMAARVANEEIIRCGMDWTKMPLRFLSWFNLLVGILLLLNERVEVAHAQQELWR